MSMREDLQESVGKSHLSYSSLKYALGDMRLWEMYMRGQLKKESDALRFGSLYDLLLFEPEKFNDVYYTLDDSSIIASIGGTYPRNTKRYKEWKAEASQVAENADKILASEEDVKKAHQMIERLKDCGLYDKRFAGGKYQVEFNVDLDGVPLKGFLDCLQEGDYIVDSKSSRSIDKFRYDVNSWSYDIQAYIYTKVFGLKDFYWVVQEKAYPFYPADVKCTEETLFRGEMKFHQAIENIQAYLNGDKKTEKHYAEFVV
mgnify:FL=1|tara:strand:- start:1432 stop:2205 length:774 start_codon:yes stop_codon:yes gene_type:complete